MTPPTTSAARRAIVPKLIGVVVAASATAACGASGVPSPAAPPTPTAAATVALTSSPAVSPIPVLDGEPWIAFEWYAEGNTEKTLFLVRPDGRDQHQIVTDVPGEQRGPVWSPDGRRLAFVIRSATSDGAIWTSNADGSGATQLFDPHEDCPGGAFWPMWSPTGDRLSITCYTADEATLAVLDLKTLTVRKLVGFKEPDFLDNPATWSPDGRTIAFDLLHWDPTNQFIDGSRIGTVPVAGGDVKWLTELDTFAAWPAWHPSQDLLVFNTYDLGSMHEITEPSNLWTIHADGTGLHQLTTLTALNVRLAQARWTLGGTRLIGSEAHDNPVGWVEIVFVDPATGIATTIGTPGARPDLRPTP